MNTLVLSHHYRYYIPLVMMNHILMLLCYEFAIHYYEHYVVWQHYPYCHDDYPDVCIIYAIV